MARLEAALILALGLATACGGSTSDQGTGGSSGSGGSSGTGGSGGVGASGGSGTGASSGTGATGGSGGTCEALVPCCDVDGNPVDPICANGSPECPPGSSWPATGTGQCAPQPGACSPAKPCAANEYCDYVDDLCGQGAPGTCQFRPSGCPYLYAPVCACGGQIADNDCAANTLGLDLDVTGSCAAPSGTFPCGTAFCTIGAQYCMHATSDVGGYADTYSCRNYPPPCSGVTPSCACLAYEVCGQWCAADASGNLTLTCPGG